MEQIISVHQTHTYQMARKAVLWPLVTGSRNESPQNIVEAMEHLRRKWQRRIRQFEELQKQAQVKPLFSAQALRAMRRCYPFGAELSRKVKHTCKQRHCPYCWARRVAVKVFSRVYPRLLSPETTSNRVVYRGDVRLMRFHRRWRFDLQSNPYELVASCRNYRDWVVRRLRPYSPEGVLQLFSLEPVEDGFVVSRRAVAILPIELTTDLPVLTQTQADIPLRLDDLKKELAKVCAYPCQWLVGDASRVIGTLRVLRGFRQLSGFGCFAATTRVRPEKFSRENNLGTPT